MPEAGAIPITPTVVALSAAEVAQRLVHHPQWALSTDGCALTRRFPFADFKAAFAFMTRVAETVVHLNHDPEWTYTWAQVDMLLTTHDAQGLTELDFALAAAADAAYAGPPSP
jgi:4a-hydroxytetrahydrobiopterin dehydratase